MIGPIALPTAHTIDVIARYKPRSRKEKVSHMMMLTSMPIPALPKPCTARPAIKAFICGDKAQSKLPPRKMASAISRMGLRPLMSAMEPLIGVEAVLVRIKALPIQT